MKTNFKPIVIAVAGVIAASTAFAADAVKAAKVEVVSTTPLQGIGITLDKVPANIQIVKDEDFKKQKSTSIADYMTDNLQGVAVNDTQNNPFQPDILFRGFSASPLLGTPQGMSIYVDGVRVNEPFGDAVNWDLIPMNAIGGMQLVPGTNPVYGLNTLGGAISIQTKSGRTHQGGGVEASAGSWGRKTVAAEYGGVSKDGSVDYFISANSFREDGWRDHSDTDVRQIFAKTGWQNETSKIDLSFTGAENDMIGNGLVQNEIIQGFGREAIHTKPDQTKNTMAFLNLSGSHWFSDDVMFSGNTYYRHSKRKTLNGDVNDGLDPLAYDDGGSCSAGSYTDANNQTVDYEADESCSGVLNRSQTRQNSYGLNGQLVFNQDLVGKKNQFTVGAAYDISRIKFTQSEEVGTINSSRGVDGLGEVGQTTNLHGETKTWSLFGTNTLSLNESWHLTASGRYNHVKVENRDQIVTDVTHPASLSGDHTFNRLNPAVGLNFTPTKDLTVYGSYNEGNRAPTSMELGCANPATPCLLPNAMAGDPPLKQVVVKTYEAGMRGNLTDDVRWTAAIYRSENHNDIQFIHSADQYNTSMGYFDNVGKTRRVGMDLGLLGAYEKFSWNAGYSYVNATYQSEFDLPNEVNSTVDAGAITVQKGDRLANIPKHQFKLRMQYAVTPDWYIGSNIVAFSDRYMRGNENNDHVANNGVADLYQGRGKIGGYTIVNLDTRYNVGNGWSVFGKAINIFDKEYSNAGMLGETHFGADGVFTSGQDPTAYRALGAPRAGWIGVRYDFAAPKVAE